MNIKVGSSSALKLDVVRLACLRLHLEANVTGIKTSSGQNEQPVGFEETYRGALARANAISHYISGSVRADIVVGIESGIFRSVMNPPATLDIAVIVIITAKGRTIITTSEGILFPEEYVRIAEDRGFKTTTVGSVIADKWGGDPADPHSALTNSRITRAATLVAAVVNALRQL